MAHVTGLSAGHARREFPWTASPGEWPFFVGLLGSFRLLRVGEPVPVRSGGRYEVLLSNLAVHNPRGMRREALLLALWPDSDPILAGQSLNSLVYGLRKLLGDGTAGPPVVQRDGIYRLNFETGIGVDVHCFDGLAAAGHRYLAANDRRAAADFYSRAVRLYQGDLCGSGDVYAIVERERLRALYLTQLSWLAQHALDQRDYQSSNAYALQLLAADPCREDAHRVVMACHVRRGERAQAVRQYQLCESVLRAQFAAEPEPATKALFDLVRTDPSRI